MSNPKEPETDQSVTELDKFFFTCQNETANQAVKGLLVINGGATIALLAFLQAIWKDDVALARHITIAIGIFCVGLAFAGASSFFRIWTSKAFQYEHKSQGCKAFLSICVQWMPLLCFVVGVAKVIFGVLSVLDGRVP